MPATPIRLPAPPPFELWFVPLAADPGDQDVVLLDEHERARAARLVFEDHRRCYVAAHAGLRRLLGRRLGVAPEALAFERAAHGKPVLGCAPRCSFSLSRSGDQALVALADEGDIGVDLERLAGRRDVDALARRYLGRREQLALAAVPQAAREVGRHDLQQPLVARMAFHADAQRAALAQIGRASCRERV